MQHKSMSQMNAEKEKGKGRRNIMQCTRILQCLKLFRENHVDKTKE